MRRGSSSRITSRAGPGPGRHRAVQLRGLPLARPDPGAGPSRSLGVMHRLVRADHDLPVAVERTGTIVAQTRTSLAGPPAENSAG